jgi:hypothetical protein
VSDELEQAIARANAAIEKAPPPAEMFYEDEDADEVALVMVRVEYKDGRIREYGAKEPQAFDMNDPETDLPQVRSMGRAVQAAGSPWVQMFAAVPTLRLSFTANPRHNMVINTERTAAPARGDAATRGTDEDEHRVIRPIAGAVVSDSDTELRALPASGEPGVDPG